MQNILAAKQVGDVSYLVSNDSTLRTILIEERIISSDKQEKILTLLNFRIMFH